MKGHPVGTDCVFSPAVWGRIVRKDEVSYKSTVCTFYVLSPVLH